MSALRWISYAHDRRGRAPMALVASRWRGKRVLDCALGVPLAIAALPVIGLLALLVRLDSPGPPIFRQERIGLRGRRFQMLKLRTMRAGAPELPHRDAASAWFASAPAAGGYKAAADPRVTRVGRFLRRTSLDELPQLFNVLRGDMSLVGPRPAIPYELEHYAYWHFDRQLVPPGMTGLWQVSGRDRLSAAEMMRLDVRYVRRRSLRLDLAILARTPLALAGRPWRP